MTNIFRILFVMLMMCIIIDCQGGGGGRRSSGSRGSSFRTSHSRRSPSLCKGNACFSQYVLVASLIAGFLLILFIIHHFTNKPIPSNVDYINVESSENQSFNQFVSGIWSYRYFQYGTWYGPYRHSLTFQPDEGKVTGYGSDDIGDYSIDGIYSVKTNRIALTKTYQLGTGDPQQNLGHNVTIQLAWIASKSMFEGKWFVKTNKYKGQDKFELKFEKSLKEIE